MKNNILAKLSKSENDYSMAAIQVSRHGDDVLDRVLCCQLNKIWDKATNFSSFDLHGLSEKGCEQFADWFDKEVVIKYNLVYGQKRMIGINNPDKNLKSYTPALPEKRLYFDLEEAISSDTEELILAPSFAFPDVYDYEDSSRILVGMQLLRCGKIVPSTIYYTESTLETAYQIMAEFKAKLSGDFDTINNSNKYPIGFLTVDPMGNLIKRTRATVIDKQISLNQFNLDLPTKDIEDFIVDDKSGSVILHGTPGCGKSTYIKYLIKKYGKEDCKFMLVSQNVLSQHLEQFKNMLMTDGKNTVYVIEDCEELLRPRERGNHNSYLLADLLNFMDGIAAEACRAKFIFTFNTKLTEIDAAILRKGRCRVRYEFKPLVGEYLKELCKAQGYELTEEQIEKGVSIADIFNKEDRDNGNVQQKKRIGFA